MLFYWLFLLCSSAHGIQVLDQNFWKQTALEDLKASLNVKLNTNIAKNIILFIGDGMGPNTATAARIYSEGETGYLSWEKFPHVGAIKTYSTDKQVPDSSATATAMYTGIKVNQGTLGVDSSVKRKDCNSSLLEENSLVTIASLAQEAGKHTGIVTTTRITHATPAAMYAHSAERNWECDTSLPPDASLCKDIGRQLVEDNPGRHFNVIMGGGRQILKTNSPNLTSDPIVEDDSCIRSDGRDLIAEWAERKKSEGVRYAVVNNTKSLLEVDIDNNDYLLGIFFNDHLPYDYLRDRSETGVPSLEQMATTAVRQLMKNEHGFMLMVEGGMIDHAHHYGRARIALSEVVEFSKAINGTMKLLEEAGIKEETLVIITSDHSHTLTISGYPERGNDILGIASNSRADGIPYTTLMYANAGKDNYHYKAVNGIVVREDPSSVNTTSFEYALQAAVLNKKNSHGGSDVLIYATGPYAHLFHHMHEQNYIGIAMRYAARLGEFSSFEFAEQASGSPKMMSSVILLIAIHCFIFFNNKMIYSIIKSFKNALP